MSLLGPVREPDSRAPSSAVVVDTTKPPTLVTATALTAIALLAFALRYDGITFGFPIIVHPDEPQIANPAINILRTGSLHPLSFLYPSLYIYMVTLVFGAVVASSKLAGSYAGLATVPIATLYYWGRMLTVVLSVATVCATFALARRVAGVVAGLVAALITACSFLHVSNSFTLTTDAPMALWVVLSVVAAHRIYAGRNSLGHYLLAGALVGLAGGTKYNAVFATLPLVLSHLLRSREGRSLLDWRFLAALAAVPLVFVASTPFSLIDHDGFIAFLDIQRQAYSLTHPGAEAAATSYGFYARALQVKLGLGPLVAAALGALLVAVRRPRLALLLLSFPVLFYVFMGAYRVRFDRNIVVVVPFVALFAGVAVSQALVWARGSADTRTSLATGAALVGLLALLAPAVYRQAAMSAAHTDRITLPNTRYLAKVWVEENLPAGARIAREHYTPPIDESMFDVTQLGYYGLIRTRDLERFDYLVASSDDFGRFVFHPGRYPTEAARYNTLFQRYRVVRRFRPEANTTSGPSIVIYATKPDLGAASR